MMEWYGCTIDVYILLLENFEHSHTAPAFTNGTKTNMLLMSETPSELHVSRYLSSTKMVLGSQMGEWN